MYVHVRVHSHIQSKSGHMSERGRKEIASIDFLYSSDIAPYIFGQIQATAGPNTPWVLGPMWLNMSESIVCVPIALHHPYPYCCGLLACYSP